MQIELRVDLLTNAAATGTDLSWRGGKGLFTVEATAFGGDTVKLQVLCRNGNWVDVKNQASAAVALTSNGMVPFELPACRIRASMTGTATGVYATAIGMHQ